MGHGQANPSNDPTRRRPPASTLVEVAAAVLDLEVRERASPVVRYLRAIPSVAAQVRRLEAERLAAQLGDQPAGVRDRLAADRVNRSPSTFRRWRRSLTSK